MAALSYGSGDVSDIRLIIVCKGIHQPFADQLSALFIKMSSVGQIPGSVGEIDPGVIVIQEGDVKVIDTHPVQSKDIIQESDRPQAELQQQIRPLLELSHVRILNP